MEFLELAKNRFSSRNYTDKPIEKEILLKILEAARIAPSAANYQPWHIMVFQDEESRKKICSTYTREWLKKAPVVLMICGDRNKAWVRSSDKKNHVDVDIAIAVDHMTLQATELGLATCWICNFDAKKCAEIFHLPENIEPIVILPIAYPSDLPNTDRHKIQRKQLNEIVHWEKF